MNLAEKQAEFARCIGELLVWAHDGETRRLRFAQAYDPPGSNSRRSPRSLHRQRLAVDLVLDLWNGRRFVYQRSTEAYRVIGEQWWKISPLAEWGGHSRPDATEGRIGPRGDGNHFSFRHDGRW